MMKNYLCKTAFTFLLCLGSVWSYAKPVLSALFSDNMVLQQNTQAPIWGEATPGKQVKITPSWSKETISVTADETGKWKTSLPTPAAGGPYTITISDGKKIQLSNVMIGEVWICSGQSNMEMPLAGWGKVLHYEQEIAAADHPDIRLFQIKKTTSLTPSEEVQSTMDGWQPCAPETVENFSSVAYFYARELNRELGVPVGVIDVTWGGTVAEAWTSEETLKHMPDFEDMLTILNIAQTDKTAAEQKYQATRQNWEQEMNALDEGLEGQTARWANPELNTETWKNTRVPAYIEQSITPDLDGVIWFRKEIDLPKTWLNEDLKITLGPVDDEQICNINGVPVGQTHVYNLEPHYTVPNNLHREGPNVLTVRVNDTGGEGGIYGKADLLTAHNSIGSISLAGTWKYRIGLDLKEKRQEIPEQPVNPFSTQNYPSLLFNAMIHPLIPYAMQGAIWYQGEANEHRGYQYRDLFSLLIRDWRTQWNRDFPFYFVQLANYKQRQAQPEESEWAEVREAQKMALSLENTGMAVIYDIGEAGDIHPKNKQEVARRLALISLANTYRKDLEYSGPLFRSQCIKGNYIELSFDHLGGGLVAQGESLKGFSIAGPDHRFHWAKAEIIGDKVRVSSPEVAYPVAVRYGWGNNVESNLYNKAGLPASPFRTDDYPGITGPKIRK